MENLTTGEDFIIDVGMRTKFVSEGKNYTVITPALGELTYTSQFLDLGLHLGFMDTQLITFDWLSSSTLAIAPNTI